jgi:hypothetical protein
MIPELMPYAHRHSPMSHAARRIVFPDLHEFLFCLLVPKRMEQCDAAFKGLLNRSGTRDWKVDGPQLLRSQIFVMMAIIGQ